MTNLLTVLAKVFSNTLMFCCKNVSSFCTTKATHIFAAKIMNVLAIFQDGNFKVTLLTTSLSFEQLGPGGY